LPGSRNVHRRDQNRREFFRSVFNILRCAFRCALAYFFIAFCCFRFALREARDCDIVLVRG
jgi:hypothetical protein